MIDPSCRDRTPEDLRGKTCTEPCVGFVWPPRLVSDCISPEDFPLSAFSSAFNCAFGPSVDVPPPAGCISELPSGFTRACSCAFGASSDDGGPGPTPPCEPNWLLSAFNCAFGSGFGVGSVIEPPDPIDPPPICGPNVTDSAFNCEFDLGFGPGGITEAPWTEAPGKWLIVGSETPRPRLVLSDLPELHLQICGGYTEEPISWVQFPSGMKHSDTPDQLVFCGHEFKRGVYRGTPIFGGHYYDMQYRKTQQGDTTWLYVDVHCCNQA